MKNESSRVSVRERFEDVKLLDLRMEEGALSQEMWIISSSWKSQGNDSCLEFPEGKQPGWYPDVRPILHF